VGLFDNLIRSMRRQPAVAGAQAESSRRFESSGGERGLGIAYLHDELVNAGLIPGPHLVKSEWKPI
jgi:hypothetical protein